MRRNKHLLLWSSLGCLVLLAIAAVEEHLLQDWRQVQSQYQQLLPPADSDQFQVQLRQVVVPSLGVADRCVSCHLGMGPGAVPVQGHPVFGAHPDVVHDPLEYGCTVCHGGQGRATATKDAHGEVAFWPEPMIPVELSEAGCGTCHSHLSVPNRHAFLAGRGLFERYDCLTCHSVDGKGGTLRPFVETVPAPDLSRVGHRGYRADWYSSHLKLHLEAAGGPWKDSFSEISSADQQALKSFLASRVGAPGLMESKSQFHSLGCRGCHAVNGVGGDDGPDLTRAGKKDPGQLDFSNVPGERSLSSWWTEHFKAPAKVVPGSQMPPLTLRPDQIASLNLYLFSLRQSSLPEAFWPLDRVRAAYTGEREFSQDGETLYGTFCAACHGGRGEGLRYAGTSSFPALANPDLLGLASDRFLEETIRRGRPGRRMPAWGEKTGGLKPDEIQNVVRYLRRLGNSPPPEPREPKRWVLAREEPGNHLYQSNCSGCHGRAGEGAEGPALANPVFLATADDLFLIETVRRGRRGTSMPSFEKPSPTHMTLSQPEIESVVAFIRTWEKSE